MTALHATRKVHVQEDDYGDEYEDDDGDGDAEVEVNNMAVKESALLILEVETDKATFTYMLNVNPKKKKTILNLARRSKPKLLKYFRDHAFTMTVNFPDGSQKHYGNRKLMKQIFSAYESNEEDRGLEPVQPNTEKRQVIYA